MYVLFIVLNEAEYLPQILMKMKELNIRGATVIDSMGAARASKDIYNIPVIGGIMKSMEGDVQYNKTIFSVIERETQVRVAMDQIEKLIGGDMSQPSKGIMFVMPVTHIRGGDLTRHIKRREHQKFMSQEFENDYY